MVNLKVGSVFLIQISVFRPPKLKRVIIAGESEDGYLGVVLMNSEVNYNVNRQQSQLDNILLFDLKPERNFFLKHDSSVDCNKVYPLSKEKVLEELEHNPKTEYYGELSRSDLELIQKTLRENTRFIPKIQKIYFNLIDEE